MKSEKSKLFTLNSTENILKLKGKSSSLDLKDKVTISIDIQKIYQMIFLHLQYLIIMNLLV